MGEADIFAMTFSIPFPATAGLRKQSILPGVLLCLGVTALAILAERIEIWLFGRAWLEALVLAILVGTVLRTAWTPPSRFQPGIAFAAKILLEIAVALLGLATNFATILAMGLPLVAGTIGVVMGTIGVSYAIGRVTGLPSATAMLVACGNAVCGNSAIAAVAPVIGAESDEVASAIAFTAAFGVIVVLLLPWMAGAMDLTPMAGGALAGLTVYAVPQVLAAAAPMGPAAVQIGTLVKLVRVLTLGPLIMVLSLTMGKAARGDGQDGAHKGFSIIGAMRFLPWFVVAFLGLSALRSADLVPEALLPPAHLAADWLTVISMAALGLGVDFRQIAAAGPRIVTVVILSLTFLGTAAMIVLRVTGLAG